MCLKSGTAYMVKEGNWIVFCTPTLDSESVFKELLGNLLSMWKSFGKWEFVFAQINSVLSSGEHALINSSLFESVKRG